MTEQASNNSNSNGLNIEPTGCFYQRLAVAGGNTDAPRQVSWSVQDFPASARPVNHLPLFARPG